MPAFKQPMTKDEVKKLIGYDLPYVVDAIVARNLSKDQILEVKKALDAISKCHNPIMAGQEFMIFERSKEVAALLADPKYTKHFARIAELTKLDGEPALLTLENASILEMFKKKPDAVVTALGDIQGGRNDDVRWNVFSRIPDSPTAVRIFLDYCDGKINKETFLDKIRNAPGR